MRLFLGRASPRFRRLGVAIARQWVPTAEHHPQTTASCFALLSAGEGRNDGLRSSLVNDKRLRPFFALNSARSPLVVPLVWSLRFRLKGKTMRIRRFEPRRYSLRVGTSHPAVADVKYGVSMRHTAKQKQSMWGSSWSELRDYAAYFSSKKYPNLYHGRGLRPSRLALFWKSGKVSAYR